MKAIFFAAALAVAAGTAVAQERTEYGKDQGRGQPGQAPDRITLGNPAEVPQCANQPPIILPVPPCPEGRTPILFDQPVYDDQGLFVVCLKKTPFCIPDDLEPEG